MSDVIVRKRWWGLLAVALLAALVWARPGGAQAEPGERVHPAVDIYEAQHPGERVPVIVQVRDGASQAASQLAHSLGAPDEFPLIDGFAAALTPAEIARVAADPDVRMVSLDAVMTPSDREEEEDGQGEVATAFPYAANAVAAWDEGVTGEGVTVAVIDSGIAGGEDFGKRLTGRFSFSGLESGQADRNGHGTYVAAVAAGDAGEYVGIAPGANLVSLKVAGREGAALASDVIEALQWAVDHRDEYNIRVVNISLTSSLADSYRQDPLDAAVEQAWFQGIVVVAAAGNFGGQEFAADHAPANDPFVITVGAFDDASTVDNADDQPVAWSSQGLTVDGHPKPELMAPGQNIVSALSSRGSYVAQALPGAVVDGRYIRLSGTSPAAAIVSGAVALMLEEDPDLTPDQVKFRLVQSGQPLADAPAPRLDAFGAVFSTSEGLANQGSSPSDLIDPDTGEIIYDSVLWRSVLWRSVLWRSVLWNSVLWSR